MRGAKIWITFIGLLAIARFLPARAADPQTIADVRCALVGFRIGQAADSAVRSSGIMLALYYLGRLDGRDPKLDVEKLIIEQVKTMTNADYSSEAVRCGNSLTTKGQQITRIGRDLIKRGQETQKVPRSEP